MGTAPIGLQLGRSRETAERRGIVRAPNSHSLLQLGRSRETAERLWIEKPDWQK